MSFRHNWLPGLLSFLQSNPFSWLLGLLLVKQQWHSWVVNTVSRSRNLIVRSLAAIFALPVQLFRFLRARVWSRVWNVIAQRLPAPGKVLPLSAVGYSMSLGYASFGITGGAAELRVSSTPELPPGTPGAVATAMQPVPMRPQYDLQTHDGDGTILGMGFAKGLRARRLESL